MKDIGLMDYSLILEVWKKPSEFFLGQGKYVINMLQNFCMMDCISMDTPMVTNLKKLRGYESSLVDLSMYHRMIGPLMYLVKTRLDIFFVVNTLTHF